MTSTSSIQVYAYPEGVGVVFAAIPTLSNSTLRYDAVEIILSYAGLGQYLTQFYSETSEAANVKAGTVGVEITGRNIAEFWALEETAEMVRDYVWPWRDIIPIFPGLRVCKDRNDHTEQTHAEAQLRHLQED